MRDVEILKPLTEEDIRGHIKMVLNGKSAEFAPIVRNFQDQIFAVVLAQVGNQTVAAEISQDTFVRAYKYLGTFKGSSSFSTWLTRIALNRVSTYFGSSAYKKNLKSERFKTAEHEQVLNNQNDSEVDGASEDLLEKMRFEVSQLKDKYREVIVMKVFEGRSYQEIAKVLDIPVGTVSSRMNTALLSLRGKLKEVC